MPFPPPLLPIDRTNATPQQDVHPADHNAVNLAVNDISAHIQKHASNSNRAYFSADIANVGTGAWVIYDTLGLAVSNAVQVTVVVNVEWGFSGGEAQVACSLNAAAGGGVSNRGAKCDPAVWATSPLTYSWNVPAGGNAGFHIAGTVFSPNSYLTCQGWYQIVALQ